MQDKQSRSTDQANHRQTVCRQNGAGWLLIFLFVLMGGLLLFPQVFEDPQKHLHSPEEKAQIQLVGMCILGGSALFSLYLLFWARVVADETGIRWRRSLDWNSFRWDEITDFYIARLEKNKKGWRIEAGERKVLFSEASWGKMTAFREKVSSCAVNCSNREWAEIGGRETEKWPLEFDYASVYRKSVIGLNIASALIVLFIGWFLFDRWESMRQNYALMGTVYLGIVAFQMAIILMIPALAVLMLWTQKRVVRNHLQESWTAFGEGLSYRQVNRETFIRWSEIKTVYNEPSTDLFGGRNVRLETVKGDFSYASCLKDAQILTRLIGKKAASAVEQGLNRHSDHSDNLGRNLRQEVGETLYHYRTRSARAMLVFLSSFPLTFIGMYFASSAGWLTRPEGENTSVMLWIGLPLLFPFFWFLGCYLKSEVRTDVVGITQRTLFGTKSLYWSEIHDFYLENSDIMKRMVLVGAPTKLHISVLIYEYARLANEIKMRAVNASAADWNEKTKQQLT